MGRRRWGHCNSTEQVTFAFPGLFPQHLTWSSFMALDILHSLVICSVTGDSSTRKAPETLSVAAQGLVHIRSSINVYAIAEQVPQVLQPTSDCHPLAYLPL